MNASIVQLRIKLASLTRSVKSAKDSPGGASTTRSCRRMASRAALSTTARKPRSESSSMAPSCRSDAQEYTVPTCICSSFASNMTSFTRALAVSAMSSRFARSVCARCSTKSNTDRRCSRSRSTATQPTRGVRASPSRRRAAALNATSDLTPRLVVSNILVRAASDLVIRYGLNVMPLKSPARFHNDRSSPSFNHNGTQWSPWN